MSTSTHRLTKMPQKCAFIKANNKHCKNPRQCDGIYCKMHARKIENISSEMSGETRSRSINQMEEIRSDSPTNIVSTTPSVSVATTSVVTESQQNTATVLKSDALEKAIFEMSSQFQMQCRIMQDALNSIVTQVARKKDVKNFRKKAMLLYYHENKDNEAVKSEIRERLKAGQLYTDDKRIPWTLIKQATDYLFNQLSEAEKKIYDEMAKYKHVNNC